MGISDLDFIDSINLQSVTGGDTTATVHVSNGYLTDLSIVRNFDGIYSLDRIDNLDELNNINIVISSDGISVV